jgi:DNA invertase Pin-like site-specific DNA recombinase
LRAAGCTNRNIYRDKVTSARADRGEILKMLKALAPGDVVTVTRIDRLLFNARTLNELICRPQSDRVIIDRGRRVFAELPDYGELDGI